MMTQEAMIVLQNPQQMYGYFHQHWATSLLLQWLHPRLDSNTGAKTNLW